VGLWRRRIDQGELAERLMEYLLAVRPHVVGVEQGAYQQPATAALLQRLTSLSNHQLATYLQALPSVQDKGPRTRPAAAKAEAGLLFVDRELPEFEVLEREALAFPLGAHDDTGDALAGAAAMASDGVEALTRGQVTPGGPVQLRFVGGGRAPPRRRPVEEDNASMADRVSDA
jgi:predicted phage terminase large subunit-like protein